MFQWTKLVWIQVPVYCCSSFLSILFRLARFYQDSQELLFNDTEFRQLGRLWHEATILSNFMETLRTNPALVAGM